VTPAFEQRFAISLEGGLEAVLERGNGKRKRKKFRSQQRHFEDRGGYGFRDLPRAERSAALDLFLRQKAERFRALAIPDPFADAGIRAFLTALFEDPATDARLYVIESGGVIKAMLGGIVGQRTFWGMFSSYADDADAAASPGELLLWHMVERLSQERLRTLDLGPGAERYKQAWCDRTMPQVDARLALTARGRAYVGVSRLMADASRLIKRHERLKALVQKLRRYLR
jgi:CelD/BcsL family acetyltransferase involved in cellulose biosynthesis